MSQRLLTKTEKREWVALNRSLREAIQRRRDWLKAKIEDCSNLKVGDDIYDVKSGLKLGTVTEVYLWSQEIKIDTVTNEDLCFSDFLPECEYCFRTGPNMLDNTSHYAGTRIFGKKKDAIAYSQRRTKVLKKA